MGGQIFVGKLNALASLISSRDLELGARFLRSVPAFLRHPVSLEEAGATIQRRLENRQIDFLALARRAVYQNVKSPYRKLLHLAGCEYGDLDNLVQREGLEGALRALFRGGVYLTVDEFKGNRPVVRGSSTVAVEPARLRNPGSGFHVLARSGGSRGAGTAVPVDLAFVRDRAINLALFLEARAAAGWLHAMWTVPGSGPLGFILQFSACGAVPVRWFSLIDPKARGLHSRYRWSSHLLRMAGLLGGVRMPQTEYVPFQDPFKIVQWMDQVLRAGHTPHLYCYPSCAVRLCQAASETGADIRGAQFMLSGEPYTPARLAVLRKMEAKAIPFYGSAETGMLGIGCLAQEEPDDMHLYEDLSALIQPGPDAQSSGLPPLALLVSSVRPTAPLVLLNVSLGDEAQLSRRPCSCPLERLGWTNHLRTIRSYEKLTAGGMAFLDTQAIRVLEEILPTRFGGVPIDYQLVEEEAEDGQPRLRLLVEPSIGPVDSEAVKDTFLKAMGVGSQVEHVMELQWRLADLLRVERRSPLTTDSGKVLHLHREAIG